MATQVVKVKRETLEACMTCPLCNKLLREATTISLCLHTFCRRCIYEKLSDEEVDSCPVCNIDLGALPVDKLRPDHNLQDIRAKIFPLKRRKIRLPDVVPIPLPVKRKERSLSSLVVSTPKVPMQTGLTGRRSKSVARKASSLRGSSLAIDDFVKKEEGFTEDHLDSSLDERANDQRPDQDTENDVEVTGGKVDLWTPLNCLLEAANRTKSSKGNTQGPSLVNSERANFNSEFHLSEMKPKAELLSAADNEIYTSKHKFKEHGHKTKLQDQKNGSNLLSGPVKRKRLRAAARKRESISEEFNAVTGAKQNRRNNPVWFTLVASEDQKGDISLPQISSCYLRIKDGSVPVSYIQKYLVKKLDLTSETEVEILCRGQPVLPTLQIHNLVDLWFRTTSTSRRIPASVGTSAKDFVMVLSYCRKVQAS